MDVRSYLEMCTPKFCIYSHLFETESRSFEILPFPASHGYCSDRGTWDRGMGSLLNLTHHQERERERERSPARFATAGIFAGNALICATDGTDEAVAHPSARARTLGAPVCRRRARVVVAGQSVRASVAERGVVGGGVIEGGKTLCWNEREVRPKGRVRLPLHSYPPLDGAATPTDIIMGELEIIGTSPFFTHSLN